MMSINSPKISVVLPTYNIKPEWFKESLESILNQTFSDFEVLIVDDSLTDEIQKIAESYSDQRIRYIRGKNEGLPSASNLGIELAKGEYIARMDADDISLPTRFEKQIAYLDQHLEIGILGTWFEMFPINYIVKHPINVKYLDLLKCCFIGQPTVMFRKELFQKYDLKYRNDCYCEDYELWSRAIRFVRFANLPEVLLKYRWHEQNRSQTKDKLIQGDQLVRQNMLDFLTDDLDLQSRIKDALEEKQGVQIRFFIPRFIANILGLFMSHQKRKAFKHKYLREKMSK